MNIESKITSNGGFTAWVPGTNITAYAYPTSPDATAAKNAKRRAKVAAEMIARNIDAMPGYVEVCGYSAMVDNARIIHSL